MFVSESRPYRVSTSRQRWPTSNAPADPPITRATLHSGRTSLIWIRPMLLPRCLPITSPVSGSTIGGPRR